MWQLWKGQNEHIFDDTNIPADHLVNTTLRYLNEFLTSLPDTSPMQRQANQVDIKWKNLIGNN